MKVIISVSAGTDDPTRATLGILAAKAGLEQGNEITVWLQGEAVTIANKNVSGKIQGLNMPPMKDAVEKLVSSNVQFWVCKACGEGRNVGPDNWLETASYKTMGEYVSAALGMDKSLSF
jgi:uncharacterized protein involved in oxidation of intracellular sulfur